MFCVGCSLLTRVVAQLAPPAGNKALSLPGNWIGQMESRISGLNRELTKQTSRYLQQAASDEKRLQRKITRQDSAAAKMLFAGSAQRYAAFGRQIATDTGSRGRFYSGTYLPYLDSLQGAVAFVRKNPMSLNVKEAQLQKMQTQLQGANLQLQAFQAKLQDADGVKAYLQQRKQQISQYLSVHANLQNLAGNYCAGVNRQIYYYSQQLRAYKEMWSSPVRMEQQALSLLSRVPAFQAFMKEHSMLGQLFNVPGNYASSKALSGLQTKDQVAGIIQGKVGGTLPGAGRIGSPGGSAGVAALQSNLQNAESQLDAYKSKLSALGTGNGDANMPDFTPNDQHTKTFWRRLEYGFNFQTTRTDYYFPTVTDLGVSLGYKLGHNNVLGVGASYKLGWGNGIRHIAFSSEGIGLRSFVQIKIKGSFSATGGFEYNYTTPFPAFSQLPRIQDWSKSGLIGVTKTITTKGRVLKKTNLSLLWDFLSYSQTPPTQPLLFRVGYTLN
jgi:hypothetical protein